MYGYKMYENGVVHRTATSTSRTPRSTRPTCCREKAVDVDRGHRARSTPLFLSLMFVAPHGESVDPRHDHRAVHPPGAARRRPLPRGSSSRARRTARRTSATSRRTCASCTCRAPATLRASAHDFRARRESLLAVDEAVEAVVGALARTGRLDNTYILFTSDNGFFQGEHRIYKGKYLAYDPSSHVPLLIRGPGIPAGHGRRTSSSPTSTSRRRSSTRAGATADRPMDGRSMLPFARDGRLRTRRPVLHEGLEAGDIDRDGAAAGRHRRRVPRDPHRALPLRRVAQRRGRALRPRARSGRAALAPPRPPLPQDPARAAPRARAPAQLRAATPAGSRCRR